MPARQIGAIGIACFVLIAAGGLIEPLWDMPGTSAPAREVDAYTGANRTGFLWSGFVYAVGMTLFLAFAAGLWDWLRRRPGVAEAPAAMFAAGALVLTALVFAGFVALMVLPYRAPGVGPARELYDLGFGLLAMSGAPTALALGAFAAIVLESRALPAWTGWLAILGAVAHVVILGSFLVDSGFFSLEGGVIVAIPTTLFVWILGTGVALLRADPA